VKQAHSASNRRRTCKGEASGRGRGESAFVSECCRPNGDFFSGPTSAQEGGESVLTKRRKEIGEHPRRRRRPNHCCNHVIRGEGSLKKSQTLSIERGAERRRRDSVRFLSVATEKNEEEFGWRGIVTKQKGVLSQHGRGRAEMRGRAHHKGRKTLVPGGKKRFYSSKTRRHFQKGNYS